MKITEEQEKLLDSLICERLRDNECNDKLIQNFKNERGALLVEYLQQRGLKEDKEGSTAFYLVKTREQDVLMFFSLKCGELFDEFFDAEQAEENVEQYLLIIQALKNADVEPEMQHNAIKYLKAMSQKQGIPVYQALNDIWQKTKSKIELLKAFESDKASEENEKIFRVNKTYPAVELVHFCINENAKDKWKSFHLDHPMGEVIFWRFIVPKFFDVQDIVGCEYAFLFAADLSEDRKLINYYDVSLKFKLDMEIGTNKPAYDFACAFMCQKLSDIKENKNQYFENFNIDKSDIVI